MKDVTRHAKTLPKVRTVAPNYAIIATTYGKYFTSYTSTIAFIAKDTSQLYLGNDWDYSRTTMWHLGNFLGKTTAELRQGLTKGSILTLEM